MPTYLACYQDDQTPKLNCNFITNQEPKAQAYINLRPGLKLIELNNLKAFYQNLNAINLKDDENVYLGYQNINDHLTLIPEMINQNREALNPESVFSLTATEQAQLLNRLAKTLN